MGTAGALLLALLAVAAIPAGVFVRRALARRRLLRWFRATHGAAGRVVLFVHSDSPSWRPYIETNILPRLGDRAVLLNWSRRAEWRAGKPDEAKMLELWGGEREFNPLAIVVPPDGDPEVIRFWQPFLEYKHGKPQKLRAAEERLFRLVDALG